MNYHKQYLLRKQLLRGHLTVGGIGLILGLLLYSTPLTLLGTVSLTIWLIAER